MGAESSGLGAQNELVAKSLGSAIGGDDVVLGAVEEKFPWLIGWQSTGSGLHGEAGPDCEFPDYELWFRDCGLVI